MMAEKYPDDAALLAMVEDDHTGVEYIPTGLSPYYLEFRRMLQRMLLATARAGDLRVYVDGDLSIGVRPGRCLIGGQAVSCDGEQGISVDSSETTWVWLDADGVIQTGVSGFPMESAMYLPLAEVTAGVSVIEQVTDLRGETMMCRPRMNSDLQWCHQGDLASSQNDCLMGVARDDGVIADVVLTTGVNQISSDYSDSISATVKVNGVAVTSTDPMIRCSDGSGFRCTGQGDGVVGVVKDDGSQVVMRGDVVSVDVTRTRNGVSGVDANDVVVLVVMHGA